MHGVHVFKENIMEKRKERLLYICTGLAAAIIGTVVVYKINESKTLMYCLGIPLAVIMILLWIKIIKINKQLKK